MYVISLNHLSGITFFSHSYTKVISRPSYNVPGEQSFRRVSTERYENPIKAISFYFTDILNNARIIILLIVIRCIYITRGDLCDKTRKHAGTAVTAYICTLNIYTSSSVTKELLAFAIHAEMLNEYAIITIFTHVNNSMSRDSKYFFFLLIQY
jgi:hypothetical protein